MLKRLVITLILFRILDYASGQTYQPPTVIPASPAVQNFLRYGEIPVDVSTGVPNINIPLYTITARKTELPMSLSYHASGIKVKDRASIAGLGWVLNVGGFVNLTMMGSRTDGAFKPFYINADSLASKRDYYRDMSNLDSFRNFGYLLNQAISETDYQTDRGFYKLPNGQSGHFRSGYINGENAKMPYSSIKIDTLKHYDHTLNRHLIDGFKITDEVGNIYMFDLPSGSYGSTDFSLTSIISSDQVDTVRFVYKSYQNKYYVSTSAATVQAGDFRNNQQTSTPYVPFFEVEYRHSLSLVQTLYSENVLDSVITSKMFIRFDMAGDRLDSTIISKLYRLSGITIFDRFSGNQIKSYSFHQSYFGSQQADNQRLRLDSLSISGNDLVWVERYRFKYNNSSFADLPTYPEKKINGEGAFTEDFWGYYNGVASNTPISTLFIPESITSSVYGGQQVKYKSNYFTHLGLTDKLPNYNYASAGLIEHIEYPTGGKTSFEFEPNAGRILLLNGTVINQGAGFRVRRIRNYAADGNISSVKTYQYDVARQKTISSSTFMYAQRVVGGGGAGASYIIPSRVFVHSTPLESLSIDNGPPVFYERVTEYIGDSVNNVGKIVYTYEQPPQEYHYFDAFPGEQDGPRFRTPFEEDRGNYSPHLLSKIEYRIEGNEYIPVTKTENKYAEFASKKIYLGMQVIPETYYEQNGWYGDYVYCDQTSQGVSYCLTSADTRQHPYYLHHVNLHAKQDVSRLVQTKAYVYNSDTSGKVVSTTLFNYDTLSHLQLLEKIVINSTGDSLKSRFQYPINYVGAAVYDSMVARNIISTVVQQSKYKNNNFLQSSKTNYHAWSANLIAPQTEEAKITSYDPEVRLRFHAYDNKGNLTAVSKENDVIKSYIWGYNESYPVAEISGIQYTSALAVLNHNVVQNPSSDEALRFELNKIRTSYPSADITTYTYKPLVGITSHTDQNGRTIFYEYDAFGRLSFVRDNEQNILKKYCYNYNGQPELCSDGCTTTAPTWQVISAQCEVDAYDGNTGNQLVTEKDVNPCSATHNQTRQMTVSNSSACPPAPCNENVCMTFGPEYRCINGVCEMGFKVYTSSSYIGGTGQYLCTYHYEWSDNTWSAEYEEYSGGPCIY